MSKKNLENAIFTFCENRWKDMVKNVTYVPSSTPTSFNDVYLVEVKNYIGNKLLYAHYRDSLVVEHLSDGLESKLLRAKQFYDDISVFFADTDVLLVGMNKDTNEFDVII